MSETFSGESELEITVETSTPSVLGSTLESAEKLWPCPQVKLGRDTLALLSSVLRNLVPGAHISKHATEIRTGGPDKEAPGPTLPDSEGCASTLPCSPQAAWGSVNREKSNLLMANISGFTTVSCVSWWKQQCQLQAEKTAVHCWGTASAPPCGGQFTTSNSASRC